MTHFWAKTTKEGLPGTSVLEHCSRVGFVATGLAKMHKSMLGETGITPELIGFLSSLHDIGKVSPGFQRKSLEWLRQNDLEDLDRRNDWAATTEKNHGLATQASLCHIFRTSKVDANWGKLLATVLGSHHGKLLKPVLGALPRMDAYGEAKSGIDWSSERNKIFDALYEVFGKPDFRDMDSLEESLKRSFPWWLAGLVSVADWIGSDENYFEGSAKDHPQKLETLANAALSAAGFESLAFQKDMTFDRLFGFPAGSMPNEMQKVAFQNINGPGVYVIEAPMGLGKTEASLWVSYNLITQGKANGLYFALPTQATSNRVHLRIKDFLERVSSPEEKAFLIHGNSWLLEDSLFPEPALTDGVDYTSDARASWDWFSTPRRALLAPVGVGTVDQVLMGILASKFFFVRQFAISGKVVILDEVHSYDLYTGTLIDTLVKSLLDLGCTIIILSATLTRERREKLLQSIDAGESESYPLLSGRSKDGFIKKDITFEEQSKNVLIEFSDHGEIAKRVIEVANKGGAVLWICNTVAKAQDTYRSLRGEIGRDTKIGLLHSRFPFWRREELEEEWMTLMGKGRVPGKGMILISTQIVEQSVDLDADLLVSELAPVDMLLQRMGRLWRHKRSRPDGLNPTLVLIKEEKSLDELKVMEPAEIKKTLGPKAKVYEPYVLLRTLEVIAKKGTVEIPVEIRYLLEKTYRVDEKDPPSWKILREEGVVRSKALSAKALSAAQIWQVALQDEEGFQTRINEMPTISMVMESEVPDGQKTFIDGKPTPYTGISKIELAKAVHRNLVKIPQYLFDAKVENPYNDVLRGSSCLGNVSKDGSIAASGLHSKYQLKWSMETGVEVKMKEDMGAI